MKVSVLLTTYNHETYIAQAIDSVLMQETNFDFEIVIMEDCSTDRTRDIVISYQRKYPDTIRLILSKENNCDNSNLVTAWLTSSSPYVALLDGDDYWTSPLKLQKQVNFLDAHPECAICFHNVTILYEGGGQDPWLASVNQKEISTLEDLLAAGNFIPCSSTLVRRGLLEHFPDWYCSYGMSGDTELNILAAEHGKIGYLDAVMGVYRVHSRGMYSSLSQAQKLEWELKQYKDINANLGFKYEEFLEPRIAQIEAKLIWQSKGIDYQHLIRRLKEVVGAILPSKATVVVFGKGSDEQLQLGDRKVWSFLQAGDGGSEQLFAGGSQGSREAPWISPDTIYEFRLYRGKERKKLLSVVKVAQGEEASGIISANQEDASSDEAFIIATPNPVLPAGPGIVGTTTISWSTGDGSEGQVWLAEERIVAYHYPADSAEAVASLDTLREKGADFLLLPSTAFWWLEAYPEFKQHLESHYRVVAHDEDACLIYALRAPETYHQIVR